MSIRAPGRDAPATYPVGLLVVLTTAVAVRAIGLGTWSMWEDEAGSLTRAYEDPTRGFQGYFPIFFVTLRAWAEWVGLSTGALRVLPAACGVLSVALLMSTFRGRVDYRALLVAGLLLSLNLGHVFFSQSVRYYTLLLVFEILSLSWFQDALESFSGRTFTCSMAAWILALLTHFSALMMLPVYLLCGAFWLWRHRDRAQWIAVTLTIVAAIGVFFTWRMMSLSEMLGDWAITSQRDPVHVAKTMVAYIGAPLLGLGALSPWLARGLSTERRFFLLAAAFLPLLELLTLASLNFVNVTWYYAFASPAVLAVLAGSSIVSLWDRGQPWTAAGCLVLTCAYSTAFLGLYYTTAHGDRPRWGEAADFARIEFSLSPSNPDAPPAYSNVPGPLTFHLGEPPGKCEDERIILPLPDDLDTCPPNSVFIVEVRSLRRAALTWLEGHCDMVAEFAARTGPADRTIRVYCPRPTARNGTK